MFPFGPEKARPDTEIRFGIECSGKAAVRFFLQRFLRYERHYKQFLLS